MHTWKLILPFLLLGSSACTFLAIPPEKSVDTVTSTQTGSPSPLENLSGSTAMDPWIRLQVKDCSLNLQIPREWNLASLDSAFPSTKPHSSLAKGTCSGFALASINESHILSFTLVRGVTQDSFQPCPPGSVIIESQRGRSFMVRIPQSNASGFAYTDGVLINSSDSSNKNEIFGCRTPTALSLGDTYFNVSYINSNARYYQYDDLDIADRILTSIIWEH
jgi:hypothetical protein